MTNEIKFAILATDLATHFRLRAKLLQVCRDNTFNFEDISHRNLLKAILITTCDLAGQCKPYAVAKKITENVYSTYVSRNLRKILQIVLDIFVKIERTCSLSGVSYSLLHKIYALTCWSENLWFSKGVRIKRILNFLCSSCS